MRRWWAVVAISSLSALVAGADILYLDLNDSQQESEAVEAAARERGERAIKVQFVEDGVRDRMRGLQKTQGDAERAKNRACKGSEDSDECVKATQAYSDASHATTVAGKAMQSFGRNELFNAIAAVKRQGRDITSVVVSGHDGDRRLWGTYGSFHDRDLEEAILANPPVGENIRSLYLWGCYTATTDDFLHGWKRAFPHTAIGGFYGQSPLGTRKKSATLLQDLLVKERSLLEARDRKELGQIFKSLSDVQGSAAAMCVNRETVVTAQGAHSIQDDVDVCNRHPDEEKKWSKVFQCYFDAEAECEDLPLKTDGTNILRKAYDFAQKTKHCEEVLNVQGQHWQLTPIAVMRLLFDNYVRGSFERVHVKEMGEFNKLIVSIGVPLDKQLSGIGKYINKEAGNMSRKEYLDRIHELRAIWNEKMQSLKNANGHVYDARVIAMGYYLDEFDKMQSGACVPGNWVEVNGPWTESPCGIKEGMRTAISRAQSKVSEYRNEDRASSSPGQNGQAGASGQVSGGD